MSLEGKTRPIPIRMNEGLIARLDEIAGDHIEGRSGVVRRALDAYIAAWDAQHGPVNDEQEAA